MTWIDNYFGDGYIIHADGFGEGSGRGYGHSDGDGYGDSYGDGTGSSNSSGCGYGFYGFEDGTGESASHRHWR